MTTHSTYREFKKKEEAIGYELQEIFKPLRRSKKGRRTVGKRAKYAAKLGFSRGNGELQFRGSLYLSANNPKARVRFGKIFLVHRHRQIIQSRRPKYLPFFKKMRWDVHLLNVSVH